MKSIFIDGTLINATSAELSVANYWSANMGHPDLRPTCLLNDAPSPFEPFVSTRYTTEVLVRFKNHATLGFSSLKHAAEFFETPKLELGINTFDVRRELRTFNTGPVKFEVYAARHTKVQAPDPVPTTESQATSSPIPKYMEEFLSRIPAGHIYSEDTRLRRRLGDTRTIVLQFPQFENRTLGVCSPRDLEILLNIPTSSMFRHLKQAYDNGMTRYDYTTAWFPAPKANSPNGKITIYIRHSSNTGDGPKPDCWVSGL